ncbi:MAG: hypothetical protein KatS3mg011_2063 [Acidimicrobiia bacterium]|nr:MAG: hypothetical protein KatS3mg011_2063 [Acidimicrobiia bacterium]
MPELDHIVQVVSDLDLAAEEYRKAGFLVTPRSDHPFGTSNRLVVLEGSYLEIVAVTRPDRIEGQFAARVAESGPGTAPFLVIRTADPEAEHRRLIQAGLAVGDPMRFERTAVGADGSTRRAAFTVVFGPPGVFFCHHHTPEAVWQPGWTNHLNGARAVLGLEVVSPYGTDVWERMVGSSADDTVRLSGTEMTIVPGDDLRVTKCRIAARRSAEVIIGGLTIVLVPQ